MRTDDYAYNLPEELIAQAPAEPRDSSRLLVMDRQTGDLSHRVFRDLPELLAPGDLLVLNQTRVMPARVFGRLQGGGRAELLLLRRLGPGRWQVLARTGRRLRVNTEVLLPDGSRVVVESIGKNGLRDVRIESPGPDPDAALLSQGSAPLPPYIHDWVGDPERYQTVYASVEGSAAAPTAGLHFTPSLLNALSEAGVETAAVTLHVGLDTFRPVVEEDPREHPIHREWYDVPPETVAAVEQTRARGGRVIAVGTTSVRTLESWASTGSLQGWTDLFILPGFQFKAVDGMVTNFHLPRSTLLMLVSAFADRERMLVAYAAAVRERYRFFSFGDAMLIL